MQKDHTHRSSAKAGKPGALYEKFIYPPFTVLDARSGWWAQRKSDWLARGLDSGDGRSNELLFATSSHPLTQAAQAAGARVVGVPHGYLNVVQARARAYANASGAMLLPFGLDCPEAAHAIAQVARALPVCPGEVWCAAGSGTLTRALQAAWPNARHVAVLVGKKDPPTGRAERIAYPRPFASVSRQPPPFPSAANYDAKAWETLQQAQKNRAPRPGVLFWNVAG